MSLGSGAVMLEATPEEWMARLKEGHEEALAHLMTRFEKPIFAFLYRRLQGETGVVQELTQDVFLKCLQYCQRFENGRPVAAWLFTLAANAATDHLRKRGRELPEPETFDAPDLHQPSPWDHADLHSRVDALKAAMAGLTPRQKAMVQAFYGHDHGVKQIAADLGCAEGTVKATLFQSLAKLRKILEVNHEPRV